ncbi:MAG: BON domain-containing protein [Stellaceae bacterium]
MAAPARHTFPCTPRQGVAGEPPAVRSWAARQEAERAAWSAPGVKKVDDRITISA